MSNHNKKRNVGLLYEFLIQTITEALIDDDKKRSGKALKLIKKHFKPGTELHKEFRLVNALVKSTISSEHVAASIMNEAKIAARSHDIEKLDREKSLLIKSINYQLQDEQFYDRTIKEYKTYATVQMLLNSWRQKNSDLKQVATFESAILNHLLLPKEEVTGGEISEHSAGSSRLLMKIMMKKLNEKYSGSLTREQRDLIRSYAFSSVNQDNSPIVGKLTEIKETLTNQIDSYVKNNPEQYVVPNLLTLKEKLIQENVSEISDQLITRFMHYAKLNTELTTGDE